MLSNQIHYLPLSPPVLAVLVGLFSIIVALIQLGLLRYAYMRLGLSSWAALGLLLASLLGSYFNIPVWRLADQALPSGAELAYFGRLYPVPIVVASPGTLIALNIGGAIIPAVMSLYLLAKQRLWITGAVTIVVVAAVCYWLAELVPGVGIAEPVLAPALVTAVIALLMPYDNAASLAYVGGSLGTLIGADLLNLDKIDGLGAPIASIGGAGTFDSVFLTGILAVLLASITCGDVKRSPGHPSGKRETKRYRDIETASHHLPSYPPYRGIHEDGVLGDNSRSCKFK